MAAYLFFNVGLFAGLLLSSSLKFLFRGSSSVERSESFFDATMMVFVFIAFLMYPTLAQKLLRMYKTRSFGEEFYVFDEDWSLDYLEYTPVACTGVDPLLAASVPCHAAAFADATRRVIPGIGSTTSSVTSSSAST